MRAADCGIACLGEWLWGLRSEICETNTAKAYGRSCVEDDKLGEEKQRQRQRYIWVVCVSVLRTVL